MTMRKTPYARIRYPFTSDVVSVAEVESMAQDIDSGLVGTAKLASDFSKMASVVANRNAAQSIAKGVNTAISFDSIVLNNGSDSPLANANWWAAGSPTRLTAPVACVVLASAFGGIDLGSALGTAGCVQVSVAINGTATAQGEKYSPTSAITGQQRVSALTMWKLAAGDYLELKMFWTGSPAGPFNTDTVFQPFLALSMLALQSVA